MKALLTFAFLASVALAAPAQSSYTAAKIEFNHPGLFTQQQLEDAADLHPGSSFKATDLADAAQRLVDTGYFDNVGATLAPGKIAAVTVQFDIAPTPTAQMLHIAFENFVWLSHDEIESAIRARFPMFVDYLPESTPKQDLIKATLTDALAAKSITAKVAVDTVEPTLRHPQREMVFRVANPSIRVANVKLSGVSTDLIPYVQKSVNATARTPYAESPGDPLSGLTTADRILAPLLDAGYIDASLANITVTPGPPTADATVAILLSADLNAGEPYHLSGITFPGTPLLSAASFASTARLHPGDLASHALLLETLKPLDTAYRNRGYMDVIITASPTPDPATHQVAYAIDVQPGEPYRMKEITTSGLTPAAHADFDRGWLMKTGELYNPDYATTFLKKNTALQALAGYSASYKAYADPATHTVDLVITFVGTAR